jgi:DNA polymerase III delta prime subunit
MTPFFTTDSLDFFTKRLRNQKYRKDNAQDEADGAKIKKEIFAPSNAWAYAVAEQLPAYAVQEDNGWQLSGSFKKYAWARLYLREFGDQNIYFRVGVDGESSCLTYNIDTKWNAVKPDEESRINKSISHSGVIDQPVFKKDFPDYSWARLVAETVNFIKKYEPLYRHLHTLLNANMDATKRAKETANAAFAAKFANPNIILYGPPGTGKTHSTLSLAYELMTGTAVETEDQYKAAQAFFQAEQGKRVEFVTFHQNFTYEDFVQGIKPEIGEEGQLVFKPKNGIFYEIARRARDEFNQQEQPDRPGRVPFDMVFERLVQPLAEYGEEVVVKMKTDKYSFQLIALTENYLRFRRHENKTESNLKLETLRSLYEGTIGYKQGGLQLYYQYVVNRLEELAADIKLEGPNVSQANMMQWDGQRQSGSDEAARPRNYVLIIDEINRANISKVFGELITLLEKDKRLGGDNPLSVTLPSGEAKFNVPANLYLIGTMNTADKSIALLDIALRRRFEFQALYPIYELNGQRFEHADVFEKLNKEIVRLKSRDFQIGHAYFMNQPDKAAEALADILDKKVIPLLYEYFLNDDKKVKEVLVNAGIAVHEDTQIGLLRYGSAVAI